MAHIARRIACNAIDAMLRRIEAAGYLFDAPYYDGSGMLYCQMQWEDEYIPW